MKKNLLIWYMKRNEIDGIKKYVNISLFKAIQEQNDRKAFSL
jgi:hypothetical protein